MQFAHGQRGLGAVVDIESLRGFIAVCDLGSISAAADAVHRSQGALSRRIAHLERTFGAPLFDRVPDGVRLTAAGAAIRTHVEAALANIEDAHRALGAVTSGAGGQVAIAVVGTLADAWFASTLAAFTADRPEVDISVRTANSRAVNDLVRRGEATFGITYERSAHVSLDSQVLFTEPLVVACRREHDLAGAAVGTLNDLAAQRWLAFPLGDGEESASRFMHGLLSSAGVHPEQITYVDSLTAQRRMIEAGLGMALIERSSVAESIADGRADTITVTDGLPATHVFLTQRTDGYLAPAATDLIDRFRIPPG